MRVCVVAEYYPRPDDPVLGVWAHRQALAARAAGADVRVLALERPLPPLSTLAAAGRGRPGALARTLRADLTRPRTATLDGIEVHHVRFLSPPRPTSYATWHRYARRPLRRALERLDREWGIDVVHAHYALPAGAAVAGYPRPLVVSVHGGDLLGPLLQAPATRALVGRTLRQADRVLCNSAGILRLASLLAERRDHLRVVHLGADPVDNPPARHSQPTIATLAHVVPRKRHVDVLDALARLPDVRWVVIGDGPALPDLRERARPLGERVSFTGALAPRDALRALARAHVMAMPSVDEAFGVAYVEALANGVPAVGCRGEPGPEEIAAAGDGILLVPPRDATALAAAIERALGALPELSARARETARRHFSWEACGEATIATYRELSA